MTRKETDTDRSRQVNPYVSPFIFYNFRVDDENNVNVPSLERQGAVWDRAREDVSDAVDQYVHKRDNPAVVKMLEVGPHRLTVVEADVVLECITSTEVRMEAGNKEYMLSYLLDGVAGHFDGSVKWDYWETWF